MKDVCFSIFKDNSIQTVSAQDLLKNKRVLISSVMRPCQPVTHKYVTSIFNQEKFLKEHGIDEMCLLYTSAGPGGRFQMARAVEHYKSFTALHDTNHDFTKYIACIQNKLDINNTPTGYIRDRVIVNNWTYHALFNDGKLEFFTDQPTDNFMKHLTSHLSRHTDGERLMWQFRTNQKQYMDPLQESLLFTRQVLSAFEKNPANGKLIFYYNTWLDGTTPLEKYLIDTKTNI